MPKMTEYNATQNITEYLFSKSDTFYAISFLEYLSESFQPIYWEGDLKNLDIQEN